MRHPRSLGRVFLCASTLIGIGCASRKAEPELADLPPGVTHLEAVRISEDMFQAPPGMIRVFTTTRPALDAMRRPATRGIDFDSASRPLFYMGSDDDWDYYYLGDHAFGLFWRVRREHNRQEERMPLNGNSLAWREVKTDAATTRPDGAATRP